MLEMQHITCFDLDKKQKPNFINNNVVLRYDASQNSKCMSNNIYYFCNNLSGKFEKNVCVQFIRFKKSQRIKTITPKEHNKNKSACYVRTWWEFTILNRVGSRAIPSAHYLANTAPCCLGCINARPSNDVERRPNTCRNCFIKKSLIRVD